MAISLVVPVRNEAASIEGLIASIRRQSRPPDEVLFVDGGSSDRTVQMARDLTAHDSRFRVLEAGEATPGRGRNVGIAAATYAWIALTDGGIVLEPTWLERLVEVAERDHGMDVIFGNYEAMTDSLFGEWAALCYLAPKQQRPGGRMRGPSIASSLLRREVWLAVGGFPDLRAAEDLIFMERIQEQGFTIGWAPSATAWWQLQPSLPSTFRRFLLYSRHNALAQRQRDWHYGIARNYVLALPFLGLAVLSSPWWAGVLLLGAMARVGKSLSDRREGRRLLWIAHPLRVMGVGLILASIDLATFVGWAQAVWQRRRPHGDRPAAILREPQH